MKKRTRLRTRTGSLTSGDFSYYVGPVAHWVLGVTGGNGHLFGRARPSGLLYYWASVKKQARLGTRTGLLTSGNFSYYMGPIARWVLGVTGGVWAFIWAGLPQWVIELLDAGDKAGPFENEKWVDKVWKFHLLHGVHRTLGFGRYRMGCGDLFGLVCPNGLLNYWTPVKKQARWRTRTGLLTSGDFSYYMGPIDRWVSGVTRAGLSR